MAFERIVVDPTRMGGLPTIRDTRVTVGMVLSQLAAGRTTDDVLADYPYLELHDVLAALEYAAAAVKSRSERTTAFESWADNIDPSDLREADTDSLRLVADLAQRRDQVDAELTESVRAARAAHRSWSEIGAMLGVSKQAAQRKYGATTPA